MIPNHEQFIKAIKERKKVYVRFYSLPDSGVKELTCAPIDYGPGGEVQDGLNRYWLWDYASNTGSHTLGLAPQQIVDLQVSGAVFDPSQIEVTPPQWSIPRDWGRPAGAGTNIPTADKLGPGDGLVNPKQPTPPTADSCSRPTTTK